MVSGSEPGDRGGVAGQAAIALAVSRRFYAERQRQYASQSPPAKVWVPPLVIIALALVAWYAIIFHHQPWGWVVTGSLTAVACMAIDHMFRWERHGRSRQVSLVARRDRWLRMFRVDDGTIGRT